MTNPDTADCHVAGVDQHLDPSIRRTIQSNCKGGIEFSTGGKRSAVGPLHDEEHDGAITFCDHRFQFAKVLEGSRRYAIGELGEAG